MTRVVLLSGIAAGTLMLGGLLAPDAVVRAQDIDQEANPPAPKPTGPVSVARRRKTLTAEVTVS